MSDHISICPTKMETWSDIMSFQERKIICSPAVAFSVKGKDFKLPLALNLSKFAYF